MEVKKYVLPKFHVELKPDQPYYQPGQRVRGKYNVRYCGGGSLRRCRALLWAAIDQAGNALSQAQGSNPSAWRVSATKERITFIPGLLPFTMRYTNRPTGIQQVLSFSGHAPGDTGR